MLGTAAASEKNLIVALVFSTVVSAAIFGSHLFVATIFQRLDAAYDNERKQRLEIERQRQLAQALEQRIEASKRIESLGRLAGGIAHL